MRISWTHKIVTVAVLAMIATASVLTFAHDDPAPSDAVAALPQPTGADAPEVRTSRPRPTRSPEPTTSPSPAARTVAPAEPGRRVVARPGRRAGTHPTEPTSTPTKSPSPRPTPSRPTQKNLLEILLGQ
jgi:hypothetical protein